MLHLSMDLPSSPVGFDGGSGVLQVLGVLPCIILPGIALPVNEELGLPFLYTFIPHLFDLVLFLIVHEHRSRGSLVACPGDAGR
jgi:hypothetical protein